jgi:HEAT repeat protein
MSDSNPAPKPVLPGNSLPPVEPPSAAFLVQLFLIPGLIVGVIVLVWVLFNWIAHSGSGDPQDYIEALRRNSPDVWQKAEILAEMLRNDRSNDLKGNPALAGELADILDARIAAGQMDEAAINLRVYLSSALGQFNTPAGLPVLLKAVATNRDEAELPVRRAALDALGALAVNVQAAKSAPLTDPALIDTLLAASHDPESVIRLRAAFVLGIVGGPRAIDRLAEMLADPYPDVAYNAATGLARHGDARAIDTLGAMLEVNESSATLASEQAELRDEKRWAIVVNALRAVGQLAEAKPRVDLSRIAPAVRAWQKSDASAAYGVAEVPLKIREAALAAGEAIQHHGAAAPRSP